MEDRIHVASLHDLAQVHHDNVIRHFRDDAQIMGDEYDCHATEAGGGASVDQDHWIVKWNAFWWCNRKRRISRANGPMSEGQFLVFSF